MRFFCLAFLCLGLTACVAGVELPAGPAPEPEPVPLFEPDNPGAWCGYANRLIANPNADPDLKANVQTLAQQRGC
ncbi:hypothetical protein [uncultured Tateyamaria sp.]|uniref:hypothetical protein n=1 Tax=uncultured Tateyamaria sp. TaxID=455651 RepID=UPI00260AEB3F|nr:hypothetical protein [uncultured Tateyamaria sp.]